MFVDTEGGGAATVSRLTKWSLWTSCGIEGCFLLRFPFSCTVLIDIKGVE